MVCVWSCFNGLHPFSFFFIYLERERSGKRWRKREKKDDRNTLYNNFKNWKHSHKNSKQRKIILFTWCLWILWDSFLILGFYDLVMLTTLCTSSALLLITPVDPSASSGLSLDCSSCLSLSWHKNSLIISLTGFWDHKPNKLYACSSSIDFLQLSLQNSGPLLVSVFIVPVHSMCSTNIHILEIYGWVGIPKLPASLCPCWINSPQTKICIHRTLGP